MAGDSHKTPGAKILIVEEERPIRELMRTALESLGFAVQEEDNGRAGLEALRRDPPDLVILDGQMPGLSGFEVMESMEKDERLSRIPVVLATANPAIPSAEGLSSHANLQVTYMEKPFDVDDFISKVRALLPRPNAAQNPEQPADPLADPGDFVLDGWMKRSLALAWLASLAWAWGCIAVLRPGLSALEDWFDTRGSESFLYRLPAALLLPEIQGTIVIVASALPWYLFSIYLERRKRLDPGKASLGSRIIVCTMFGSLLSLAPVLLLIKVLSWIR